MIYFDNSATTKITPAVLETYDKVSQEFWGNPSSLHRLGDKADQILESARNQIATILHCRPEEIYFTSSGSEGDNWVLKGTALEKSTFGKHIVTSSIEHPAVTNSLQQLEKLGFEVTYLPVDKTGHINPMDVKEAIRPDTILVSIMAVNNEVGAIQPLQQIATILQNYPNIHFHVDAVQAIGKNLGEQIFDPRIDFMTFSGHKFHAPRGVGFIYAKQGRKIAPLINGGGQENNWRSSTENVPAIVAMAKALRVATTDEINKAQQQQELRHMLLQHLKTLANVAIFSQETPDFAPHIVCFAINGVRGETIVHAFEQYDIYLSTTSACSSKKGTKSITLKAMHVPDKIATSAIRVSLDETNTVEEMQEFIATLDKIYQHFQVLN
ncbi:cysteine desulfurase family protein [Bombilactobacillus thymidiniphilus]|uniref:Cysteine desulfurase n=1 Tax=Bombilactobacillus thymidiniphilus TaxID=2923363 RepID=A0ABY4PE97_9LACO|nr:cysteine desulfurase family protein [Bombilactobacillus thymidiniphilus]UQS83829.1 cysteine desulfurase [Bombilactobacillus thymidiniphilus]